MSTEVHSLLDVKPREILTPVPDIEPLQCGDVTIQRRLRELPRVLSILKEPALDALVALIRSLTHLCLQIRAPVR